MQSNYLNVVALVEKIDSKNVLLSCQKGEVEIKLKEGNELTDKARKRFKKDMLICLTCTIIKIDKKRVLVDPIKIAQTMNQITIHGNISSPIRPVSDELNAVNIASENKFYNVRLEGKFLNLQLTKGDEYVVIGEFDIKENEKDGKKYNNPTIFPKEIFRVEELEFATVKTNIDKIWE